MLCGQDHFCASGHTQLCKLYHVTQSDMLNFYHSCFFYFYIFAFLPLLCISSRDFLSLNRVQSPCNFLFLIWLPLLLYLGQWFHISCCGTWSSAMHKVHIALQELQAVVLMLHKIIFRLSNKVIALH